MQPQECSIHRCRPPCRLGAIDERPQYHTASQLWPVGYIAESTDDRGQACTLRSRVLDGGDAGPLFEVSLLPAAATGGDPTVCAPFRGLCLSRSSCDSP